MSLEEVSVHIYERRYGHRVLVHSGSVLVEGGAASFFRRKNLVDHDDVPLRPICVGYHPERKGPIHNSVDLIRQTDE